MSKTKEYFYELSKYLCYLLRHEPSGLNMDEYGYVPVGELINHVNKTSKFHMDETMLNDIVKCDKKQRYKIAYSSRGKVIKCNQGHSIPWIKLELNTDIVPPAELYHGTTEHAYTLIRRSGAIKRMDRNNIHLTADLKAAWKSAKRWKDETPIVLVIDIKQMIKDGYKFGVTENNIWTIDDDLSIRDEIPDQYIKDVLRIEKDISDLPIAKTMTVSINTENDPTFSYPKIGIKICINDDKYIEYYAYDQAIIQSPYAFDYISRDIYEMISREYNVSREDVNSLISKALSSMCQLNLDDSYRNFGI